MSKKTGANQPQASVPQTPQTPQVKIPQERIAKLAYEKWMKGGCKHECDQQAWLEAEAELMKAEYARRGLPIGPVMVERVEGEEKGASRVGRKPKRLLETFDELGTKLLDDDPDVREDARAKFASYGGESLLKLVNALMSDDADLRSDAREEFFRVFANFPFSPRLRKSLESYSIESRVAGIREIVMVLDPVRDAIDAHVTGWESLAALTRRQVGTDNPDSPVRKASSANARMEGEPVREDRPMKQTEYTGTIATLPHQAEARTTSSRAHLIRIPDHEAMKRAVMALGAVRVAYCGFPDSRLLVANDHIVALQREGIPFDQLS